MRLGRLQNIVVIAAVAAAGCGVNTKQNGSVKISSISPDTSSITGGVEVQIGGKGFDDGSGPPTVVFGTNDAEVIDFSDNSLRAVLPSGLACGNVDVQVNNGKGFALDENAFTYTGGSGTLTLTTISPTLGALSGDTEVTIDGSGFTGGVGVTLGGMPLRDIEILSDTQIRARTPPQITGGSADLQVRNCADEATLPDAFLFTSGENGVYVELPLFDYINTDQFAPGAQDYIDPFVAFVTPTADSLLNPLPPNLDACVFNPQAPAGGSFEIITAGDPVSLTTAGQTIDLGPQPDELYYYPASDATAYQTAKFVFNASYTLTAAGDATLAAFTAPDVVVAPSDFTVSAPAFPATPTEINRGAALQWTWSATNPGDHARILLTGYDIDAQPTEEFLDCYVRDDGSFQISGADMGNFSNDTVQMVVSITRRQDTNFVLPANGSAGVGVGMVRKLGVLYFPIN